jgi:hypothetical protein
MSKLITERIRAHATRLALPHLAASLDQLITRANTDKMGYLEFLDLVLEEEAGVRDGRRFRSALRLSRLPHHRDWTSSISRSSPTSSPAKSRTWPPSPSSKTRPMPLS